MYFWIQRLVGGLRVSDPTSRLQAGIDTWRRIQEQGVDPAGKVFFEVGTGTTPIVPLAYWLMGAKGTITIDLHPYMKSTLAREELGIDPEGLGGSAWVAAATSFVLFAVGASIPLMPYLFVGGLTAVLLSGVLAAVGLFASGALGSLLTGQPMMRVGLRQVALGLVAAGVTFGLGRLVGSGLGL